MSSDDQIDAGRRTVLRTIAAGATAGALATTASPAAAQSNDLSEWFANTDNATGVTDRTGQSEVTVEVGTDGNGAGFGFGPAVVRVDPGTTVTWEWTGKGGQHNVAAGDGSFESSLQEQGTFQHTFESAGVTRYACTPHEALGMKGAIVVGDADVRLGGASASAAATGTPGESETDGASGGESAGTGTGEFDYGEWFENVSNFDGTVDATGQEEVRIAVGAQGNDGAFAFSPAAVHVDPGTRVVWEWTGEGGQHDVAAEDDSFGSALKSEAGATYGIEISGSGTVEYACTPHEAIGMKGAIVVGDPVQSGGIDWLKTGLVGLAGAIVATPFVASQVAAERREDDDGQSGPPTRPG
ncbi:MAG: halocyanin domain-containing protein [Haloarculaceae archaeon]